MPLTASCPEPMSLVSKEQMAVCAYGTTLRFPWRVDGGVTRGVTTPLETSLQRGVALWLLPQVVVALAPTGVAAVVEDLADAHKAQLGCKHVHWLVVLVGVDSEVRILGDEEL